MARTDADHDQTGFSTKPSLVEGTNTNDPKTGLFNQIASLSDTSSQVCMEVILNFKCVNTKVQHNILCFETGSCAPDYSILEGMQ